MSLRTFFSGAMALALVTLDLTRLSVTTLGEGGDVQSVSSSNTPGANGFLDTAVEDLSVVQVDAESGYVGSSGTFTENTAALDFNAFSNIDDRMKPCEQSKSHGPCNWRVEGAVGGTHCPKDECCSKIYRQHGSLGGWCVNSRFLCHFSFLTYPDNSFGSCRCSEFSGNCPRNSECVDSDFGAYCRCTGDSIEKNGRCIPKLSEKPKKPKQVSTTTTTTTTAQPVEGSTWPVGSDDDDFGCVDECKPPNPEEKIAPPPGKKA